MMTTTTKTCKDCNVEKDINMFETTTPDKKSRRSVCKPCYKSKRTDKSKKAAKSHDPLSVPKPAECAKCGRGPGEVEYKWRTDVQSGGWRSECNSCYNDKGYCEKSRDKCRTEDPIGYLKKNAEAHLKWAHNKTLTRFWSNNTNRQPIQHGDSKR